MNYTLLDRPNPNGPHYYTTRNEPLLAIVMHITAGLEDLDTVDDHSAENTAEYCRTTDREVSWHSGSDADSFLYLLPPTHTAWHATSYNSCTYGHEQSKKHTDWRTVPADWVGKTIRNAAKCLAPVVAQYGVPIRKATRAELDRERANFRAGRPWKPVGFISHAELQPADRTDPGLVGTVDTYPWADLFAALADPNAQEAEEDVMFQTLVLDPTGPAEVKEINIGLPWQGQASGINRVNVCVGSGNEVMTIDVAHWRVHEDGDSHPVDLVKRGTKLNALSNTGGVDAPKNTRSLVLGYTCEAGGFVVIEATR